MASTGPGRAAPPPPSGIEEALAQLRDALARDPSGFATDEATRAILERLNEGVERAYEEDRTAGAGAGSDGYDDDGGDGGGAGAGRSASPASSRARREARVELPKGPRPVDLWRAAHEVERHAKGSTQLTKAEEAALLARFDEAHRAKHLALLQTQLERSKGELDGLTFRPNISQRSRELAAHNKSLPERVAAMLKKKKARLDKIRNEKALRELAEATFRPNINKPRTPADADGAARRRLQHLMQFEAARREKLEVRAALVAEMEERELTFAPAINANSSRIVARLAAERSSGAGPASPAGATSARTARRAAIEAALAAEAGVPRPSTAGPAPGRSALPGHEEETFRPKINPRSAALFRPGIDDKDVYARLYEVGAGAKPSTSPKRIAAAAAVAAAARERAAAAGSESARREPRRADASGYPLDEAGEPAPGHPAYFNVVAYAGAGRASGNIDAVLRRVLGGAAAAAASGSA